MGPRVALPLYGQLKEHVSFSELRLFNECNWKWLLLKVFGIQSDEKSFQMDFGKAIHSGMEILYSADNNLRIDTAIEHATNAYDLALSVIGELHPTDAAEALKLRGLIKPIFRDTLLCPELIGIKPLKSELQLMSNIARTDGLDIKFKGFIDIIFIKKLARKSVIYIADFKTCQWGWPAKKLQDIEVISQILLYKHFFCKLTGADPQNVTAAFILLKKSPQLKSKKGEPEEFELSVEVKKISAGPKATQQALDYMQKSITGMHSYSYEKNFSACTRNWIDKETKLERVAACPFLNTSLCHVSEKKVEDT